MRSLRLTTRLVILSTLLTLVSMGLGLAAQVVKGRARIEAESRSAVDLAWQLVDSLLSARDTEAEASEANDLIQRLQQVEVARHLDIRVSSAQGEILAETAVYPVAAPAWFARLVAVPSFERSKALMNPPGSTLLIRSSSVDEVAETWDETRNFLWLLCFLLLGFNAALYLALSRWLAPVMQIVQRIERTGSGDFSGKLPIASLPELRTIASKLDELNASLQRAQSENDRLAVQALKIQEAERHFLAQELHDELGQSLSAIKAIAWSMQQQAAGLDQRFVQGASRIGSMATVMSGHVRTMLEKLRPSILDEMGLTAAIAALVNEWNETYTSSQCRYSTDRAFDGIPATMQIHVYRIVQAALTNVADHAQAASVELVMRQEGDTLLLGIRDNGKGFDALGHRRGRGLVTMRERVQLLGGSMQLVSTPAGTELKFAIPR